MIAIDAWSTGNDLLPPISSDGVIQVTNSGNWAAVTVSFTDDTPGTGSGSTADLIQQRADRFPSGGRTGPGADLYTYYLPGSSVIAPRLVGKTVVEQAAEHIGVGSSDDIDALDFGMGVFSFQGSRENDRMYQRYSVLYFSLSRDSAIDLNNHYMGEETVTPHFAQTSEGSGTWVSSVNPAAVYAVSWDESNRSWSDPFVYRTCDEVLNLDLVADPTADASTYDVDALAVSHAQGPNEQSFVIFSTSPGGQTGLPMASQIMVSMLGAGPAGEDVTAVLKDDDGPSVIAEKVGSGDHTKDVDALCISDPHQNEFDTHLGYAVDEVITGGLPFIYDEPLGISIARVGPPIAYASPGVVAFSPQEELVIQVTGLSHPNDIGGLIQLFMRFSSDTALPGDLGLLNQNWIPLPVTTWDPNIQTGLKDTAYEYRQVIPTSEFAGNRMFCCAAYTDGIPRPNQPYLSFSYISAIDL